MNVKAKSAPRQDREERTTIITREVSSNISHPVIQDGQKYTSRDIFVRCFFELRVLVDWRARAIDTTVKSAILMTLITGNIETQT